MAKVSIGLPIKERKEKSEIVTSPQTKDSYSSTDSRLTNKIPGTLTYKKIRDIRKDPTISLIRQVVVAPAFHTEWTIATKENAPSGAKELIEKVMMKHRLHLLQTSFLGCMDFGWMPYERVLEEVNGELLYTSFKGLLQDYTDVLIYTNTGRFAGYFNQSGRIFDSTSISNAVELTEEESLHIVLEREADNWYGRSISEVLEGTYDKYKDVNSAASRYDSKVAGAHWIVYYPPGKTEYNNVATANQDIALDILGKLQSSGAVAVPDEIKEYLDSVDKEKRGKWHIDLLSDSSGGQSSFIDRLKYLDNLKVRAFHLPERSVVEGQFGTKAEAETHTDLGLGTIDLKHRNIVCQFNHQAVNTLLRLNYGEEAEGSVFIQVAPLVDSRLSIVKDVYRLLMQNPQSLVREMASLDRAALRLELNLPSIPDAEAETILEEERELTKERFQPNQQTEDGSQRESETFN
jgi:hypothetical protein